MKHRSIAASFIVPTIIVLSLAGCSGGASYSATISDLAVVNTTQVSVTVHVKNTSGTAGTPLCVVDVYDNANSQVGSASGELSGPAIPAHGSSVAVLPVDVKNVQNVSKSASVVSCS